MRLVGLSAAYGAVFVAIYLAIGLRCGIWSDSPVACGQKIDRDYAIFLPLAALGYALLCWNWWRGRVRRKTMKDRS